PPTTAISTLPYTTLFRSPLSYASHARRACRSTMSLYLVVVTIELLRYIGYGPIDTLTGALPTATVALTVLLAVSITDTEFAKILDRKSTRLNSSDLVISY